MVSRKKRRAPEGVGAFWFAKLSHNNSNYLHSFVPSIPTVFPVRHVYWIEEYDYSWALDRDAQIDDKLFSRRKLANQFWMIPRAASATRALLRLSPCHRAYLRPHLCGDFGYSRLPWLDGRWVQDLRTYSPQFSWPAITSNSSFMESSCRLQSELRPFLYD